MHQYNVVIVRYSRIVDLNVTELVNNKPLQQFLAMNDCIWIKWESMITIPFCDPLIISEMGLIPTSSITSILFTIFSEKIPVTFDVC